MIHHYTISNKRPYNEDRFIIKTNANPDPVLESYENMAVIGVCDGHGGHEISTHVSEVLGDYFITKHIATDNTPQPTKKYNSYIIDIFDLIQNEMNAKHQKSTDQGTTVSIVLLYNHGTKKYITAINSGDSRSMACNKSLIAQSLTKDHKPNYATERKRIESAGGVITSDTNTHRINGVLAVSRSLGDFDTKQFIEYRPDIYHYENDYHYVLVASDGLWDVLSSDDVNEIILTTIYENPTWITKEVDTKRDNVAAIVAQAAIDKGSEDNITVVIYFFTTVAEEYFNSKNTFYTNI